MMELECTAVLLLPFVGAGVHDAQAGVHRRQVLLDFEQ
jgi:hypothetical protein